MMALDRAIAKRIIVTFPMSLSLKLPSRLFGDGVESWLGFKVGTSGVGSYMRVGVGVIGGLERKVGVGAGVAVDNGLGVSVETKLENERGGANTLNCVRNGVKVTVPKLE